MRTGWLSGFGGKSSFAGDDAARPARKERGIRILRREILFSHYFLRVEEYDVAYRRRDSSWSEPVRRVNVDRGDSVAALIHERDTDSLLFTNQFRMSTYDFDNEQTPYNGWFVELVAGRTVSSESAEATMRREIAEEIAVEAGDIHRILEFFPSPGALSEKITLFFAAIDGGAAHGVGVDDEEIELVRIPVRTCFDMLDRGEFRDAKALIGLQWLRLNPNLIGR